MIFEFFILLSTLVLLLLPLGFWMYIFLSFIYSGVTRTQFFIGMGAGAVATIPLIAHEYIFLGDWLYDIFVQISVFSATLFAGNMFFLLLKFFITLGAIFFCIGYIIHARKRLFISRSLNASFGYIALIASIFIWMYALFLLGDSTSAETVVTYSDLLFSGLAAILTYYIIIGIVEEGIKYLSALNFGNEESFRSRNTSICLCASVALGFAFFENILYVTSYIQQNGLTLGVLELTFFRGVFSVMLHILSSMFFAFGFWYIVGGIQKISQTLYFIGLGSLGIISHALFDTLISYGLLGALGIYIFATYIFISYLSTTPGKLPETPVSA